MTSKSTITRERLEKIKSWRETYGARSNVMLPAEEVEELARMVLATMDSESVAEVLSSSAGNDSSTIDAALPTGTKLYRHSQPAPVVPEDIPDSVYEILCQACGGKAWMYEEALWNACRAAMLQENPKSAGAAENCRSSENVQVVQVVQDQQTCNSPVIPDGYVMVPKEPTQEMFIGGGQAVVAAEMVSEYHVDTAKKVWTAMLAAVLREVK